MSDDGQDDGGVVGPPPLVYALPLLAGLVLNRKLGAPFLPRAATRLVGLPRVVGGLALGA